MAAVAEDPPAGYVTAVYACVSVLVGLLLVLLVYVLCSKRYRLNWFEKTVLEAAEENEITIKRLVDSPSTTSSDINDGASCQGSGSPPPSLPAVTTTEFWVPPSLQRQASVCQSDTPDYSGDESLPGTPNTPLGVKMSPFALQQMAVTGEKFIQPQPPSTSATTATSTSTTSAIRPRLSSMHSKLDHTKINAAMYQKPLLKTPSVPEEMRGSIQLSLTYDINFGLLVVNLIQARDLVSKDVSGTADPYAKIRILPDTVNFRHSRVHKKTLQPVFEEEFAFQIPPSEIGKGALEILIYDFDQYSRHQCMGSMQLPFERIDFSDKVTLWKGISPCDEKDEKAELGDLMFSLGYLHSAERLTVVILKARNLPFFDEVKNASDTYVKVSLFVGGKRIKKKKTSTQRGTAQPIFNEALTFSVARDQLQRVSLEVTVYRDASLGQKEPLGRVLISLASKGEEGEHYQDMINSKAPVARWHCLIDLETRHS